MGTTIKLLGEAQLALNLYGLALYLVCLVCICIIVVKWVGSVVEHIFKVSVDYIQGANEKHKRDAKVVVYGSSTIIMIFIIWLIWSLSVIK